MEARCEKETDYIKLARMVSGKLEDTEWTRKLLSSAEEKCGDLAGYVVLAGAVVDILNDKGYAASLYIKAEGICSDRDDYERLIAAAARQGSDALKEIHSAAEKKLSQSRDLVFLAESILKHFSDATWARAVYTKAEQTADANGRYELAVSISDKLNDLKWASQVRRSL